MNSNLRTSLQVADLLLNKYSLMYVRSRQGRREIHKRCDEIWLSIDRKILFATLSRMKASGLVRVIQEKDAERVEFTSRGARRAVKDRLYSLKPARPKKWDKKWRIVLFDIPEKRRKERNAFRYMLRRLGFLEFQKSVFVFPYPMQNELNFVLNYFQIYEHVYSLESKINPDNELRKHFEL